MSIKFFCTRWGSEQLEWNEFFDKALSEGYDGIEFGIPVTLPGKELDEFFEITNHRKLLVIAQHYDTYEPDFSKHQDAYGKWLEKIMPYQPLKINSQTGKDFFSFEQNSILISMAADFTKKTGIEICHETHRNKFSFAAHVTKEYLQKIPQLIITLDASHWVCVAESFLEDQQEAIQLAIERTGHLHARVGYVEGPQVPDPRAPEWQHALEMHLNWWDKIAKQKSDTGAMLTITPEFGPRPYMVHLPYTGVPITDQWAVNVYMLQLLKKRYG